MNSGIIAIITRDNTMLGYAKKAATTLSIPSRYTLQWLLPSAVPNLLSAPHNQGRVTIVTNAMHRPSKDKNLGAMYDQYVGEVTPDRTDDMVRLNRQFLSDITAARYNKRVVDYKQDLKANQLLLGAIPQKFYGCAFMHVMEPGRCIVVDDLPPVAARSGPLVQTFSGFALCTPMMLATPPKITPDQLLSGGRIGGNTFVRPDVDTPGGWEVAWHTALTNIITP